MTAGASQYASWTAYDFKVVPYTNSSGVSTEFAPASPAAYEVAATLDNRTYSSNDDPQHTTTDFGSWDGNDVSARLDLGALQVDTTDLCDRHLGTGAAVSRTYLSSNTRPAASPPAGSSTSMPTSIYSQRPAPATPTASTIDYYDACGDKHHFVKGTTQGATWRLADRLSGDPGAERLQLDDHLPERHRRYLHASGTTGVWSSEADRNGNTTTYAWNGGNLTITAANGQTIAVTCNSSWPDHQGHLHHERRHPRDRLPDRLALAGDLLPGQRRARACAPTTTPAACSQRDRPAQLAELGPDGQRELPLQRRRPHRGRLPRLQRHHQARRPG